MFSNASNLNYGVDLAFWVILGISLFFLIGISVFVTYIVIRFRKEKHPKAEQIKDNTKLEITWTVIPIILVLIMFYVGYIGYLPMLTSDKDALQIEIIARKWDWNFKYANGKESKELYVPINKSIKLNMRSLDVIHGFAIPAFRLKMDVVPGYTTNAMFIAKEEGDFDIYCSMYCGLNHSFMGSKVNVVSADSFKRWLAVLPPKADSSFMEGLTILQNNGCTGCHSLDGSALIAPTFKDFYGSKRTVMTDGKERVIIADSNYFKTSIYEPNKDIAKGYNKGIMQTYKNKISDKEQRYLVKYLESIGKKK